MLKIRKEQEELVHEQREFKDSKHKEKKKTIKILKEE